MTSGTPPSSARANSIPDLASSTTIALPSHAQNSLRVAASRSNPCGPGGHRKRPGYVIGVPALDDRDLRRIRDIDIEPPDLRVEDRPPGPTGHGNIGDHR